MIEIIVGVQKSGDYSVILRDDAHKDRTIYTTLESWDAFIKEVKRGDCDVDELLKK